MSATLVIMAAGLASRYGSAKQIEKVGPSGEILMEYTILDARKAGFDRFVIILPPGMQEEFRERVLATNDPEELAAIVNEGFEI